MGITTSAVVLFSSWVDIVEAAVTGVTTGTGIEKSRLLRC